MQWMQIALARRLGDDVGVNAVMVLAYLAHSGAAAVAQTAIELLRFVEGYCVALAFPKSLGEHACMPKMI